MEAFQVKGPTCHKCGAEMVLRQPKEGQSWKAFWGCSRFPRCKASREAGSWDLLVQDGWDAKPIVCVWVFRDSKTEIYQAIQYQDGMRSCECEAWIQTRSCAHTLYILNGMADVFAFSHTHYGASKQVATLVTINEAYPDAAVHNPRKFRLDQE